MEGLIEIWRHWRGAEGGSPSLSDVTCTTSESTKALSGQSSSWCDESKVAAPLQSGLPAYVMRRGSRVSTGAGESLNALGSHSPWKIALRFASS